MKDFSFFTYMAGDNNLSEYGLRDIEEMQKTGSASNTNILVEIDQAGDFDGVIRYEISERDPRTGKADRIVKDRLPEKDSGNPQTLLDSLKWARSLYEAKKYFIVIWNHGSGFRNRIASRASLTLPPNEVIKIKDDNTHKNNSNKEEQNLTNSLYIRKGTLFYHHYPNEYLKEFANRVIASDDMTGNSLDMIELRNVLTKAGFTGDNKIEVLGFDACLMNLLEVAYEMAGSARFLIGSEELEPGAGWPYNTDLKSLNSSNGDTQKLVTNFVTNYFKSYQPQKNQWPITQSAISLEYSSQLAESVNELAKTLSSILPDKLVEISELRESVQTYAVAEDYDDYIDLGDFADILINNIDNNVIVSAAKKVQKDLKQAVIAEAHLGEDVQHSYGLTIWFPETSHKYHLHKPAYNRLLMTKKYPEWNKFLLKYHPKKPLNKEVIRSKKNNKN
jgi:hypothetical protein